MKHFILPFIALISQLLSTSVHTQSSCSCSPSYAPDYVCEYTCSADKCEYSCNYACCSPDSGCSTTGYCCCPHNYTAGYTHSYATCPCCTKRIQEYCLKSITNEEIKQIRQAQTLAQVVALVPPCAGHDSTRKADILLDRIKATVPNGRLYRELTNKIRILLQEI